MICPDCGKEQMNNPVFCRSCGHKLESSAGRDSVKATGAFGMKRMIQATISVVAFAFLLGILLLVVSSVIAHSLVPSDIYHVQDGLCDICGKRGEYELKVEDGQVTGEFCQWHAILYELGSGQDENVIVHAPFEIMFFSQWVFFIAAGIISICLFRLFPKFFLFFWRRN